MQHNRKRSLESIRRAERKTDGQMLLDIAKVLLMWAAIIGLIIYGHTHMY